MLSLLLKSILQHARWRLNEVLRAICWFAVHFRYFANCSDAGPIRRRRLAPSLGKQLFSAPTPAKYTRIGVPVSALLS